MADDDQEPPLPPRPNQQQPAWLPGPYWDIPPLRRNNALYDSQPPFVPPPPDVEARFQDVMHQVAELRSAVDLLRDEVKSKDQVIGPGHNQGPPLSLDELDDDIGPLIALLKDDGPKIKTVIEAKPVIEQAEKTVQRAQQITAWLATLTLGAAKLGGYEVTKVLTHPLWENVAQKILDLYHTIEVWVASLVMII